MPATHRNFAAAARQDALPYPSPPERSQLTDASGYRSSGSTSAADSQLFSNTLLDPTAAAAQVMSSAAAGQKGNHYHQRAPSDEYPGDPDSSYTSVFSSQQHAASAYGYTHPYLYSGGAGNPNYPTAPASPYTNSYAAAAAAASADSYYATSMTADSLHAAASSAAAHHQTAGSQAYPSGTSHQQHHQHPDVGAHHVGQSHGGQGSPLHSQQSLSPYMEGNHPAGSSSSSPSLSSSNVTQPNVATGHGHSPYAFSTGGGYGSPTATHATTHHHPHHLGAASAAASAAAAAAAAAVAAGASHHDGTLSPTSVMGAAAAVHHAQQQHQGRGSRRQQQQQQHMHHHDLVHHHMVDPEHGEEVDAAMVAIFATETAKGKVFKCPRKFCTKVYKNSNGLKYHLEKGSCETEQGSLEMQSAVAVASNDSLKVVHRPYGCRVDGCGKRYQNLNGLKYHARTAHPSLDFKTEIYVLYPSNM
ncbi:Transcriptional regulator of ribosomal biogenesis proteins [Dinochytrium kinnereticum]|nr:Transcriptional regulator of ribosomal biogenesis proteins [Dinochytrium kinnereticum]